MKMYQKAMAVGVLFNTAGLPACNDDNMDTDNVSDAQIPRLRVELGTQADLTGVNLPIVEPEGLYLKQATSANKHSEIKLTVWVYVKAINKSGYRAEMVIINSNLLNLTDWTLKCQNKADIQQMTNASFRINKPYIHISSKLQNSEIPAYQSFKIGYYAIGKPSTEALSQCSISGYPVELITNS